MLQALLAAEWDATNTAEVMRAIADPPGEHTIAGTANGWCECQQSACKPHSNIVTGIVLYAIVLYARHSRLAT
jgi:hypothetical protein